MLDGVSDVLLDHGIFYGKGIICGVDMATYKCSYSDNRKPEFWTEVEAETRADAALIFLGDWDGMHIDGENIIVFVHYCDKTTPVRLTVGWVVAK